MQQVFVRSDQFYLNNVVDFGLDEVEQGRDASFGRLLNFDGASADGSNGFPHEVDINLSGIPKQVKKTRLTHMLYTTE